MRKLTHDTADPQLDEVLEQTLREQDLSPDIQHRLHTAMYVILAEYQGAAAAHARGLTLSMCAEIAERLGCSHVSEIPEEEWPQFDNLLKEIIAPHYSELFLTCNPHMRDLILLMERFYNFCRNRRKAIARVLTRQQTLDDGQEILRQE